MNNGYKVEYFYKDETRVGYVQFMGNNSKGKAKFAFVGTNNEEYITTFHTESGKTFWKLLNGENIPVINPKQKGVMTNMKYNCIIVDINDEEITIKIGDAHITGFSNSGVSKEIGDEAMVDILLYDDLEISESNKSEVCIERKENSFAYSLYGRLDIDNSMLKSEIDFEISPEELFDYGYLDGKEVKVDTIRIDLEFIQ